MTDKQLQGHWGSRTAADRLFQLSFTFMTQVRDVMDRESISAAQMAERLGITSGRVSQLLNSPGNLTLKNVEAYAHALNRRVALVIYDDPDPTHGPVFPEIFMECWRKQGKPLDFFELNELAASGAPPEAPHD